MSTMQRCAACRRSFRVRPQVRGTQRLCGPGLPTRASKALAKNQAPHRPRLPREPDPRPGGLA